MKDLKKYVDIHGGATLTEKGNLFRLKKGYMVSYMGSEHKSHNFSYIKSLMKKASKALKGAYMGLWKDNGKYYLDRSIRIMDKEKAIAFGKANKQLSIYDIANDSYIRLA